MRARSSRALKAVPLQKPAARTAVATNARGAITTNAIDSQAHRAPYEFCPEFCSDSGHSFAKVVLSTADREVAASVNPIRADPFLSSPGSADLSYAKEALCSWPPYSHPSATVLSARPKRGADRRAKPGCLDWPPNRLSAGRPGYLRTGDSTADGTLGTSNPRPMTAQKPVVSGEPLPSQLKRPRAEAPSAKAEGRRHLHRRCRSVSEAQVDQESLRPRAQWLHKQRALPKSAARRGDTLRAGRWRKRKVLSDK